MGRVSKANQARRAALALGRAMLTSEKTTDNDLDIETTIKFTLTQHGNETDNDYQNDLGFNDSENCNDNVNDTDMEVEIKDNGNGNELDTDDEWTMDETGNDLNDMVEPRYVDGNVSSNLSIILGGMRHAIPESASVNPFGDDGYIIEYDSLTQLCKVNPCNGDLTDVFVIAAIAWADSASNEIDMTVGITQMEVQNWATIGYFVLVLNLVFWF